MKYAIRAAGARALALLLAVGLSMFVTPAPGGPVSSLASQAARLRQIDEAARIGKVPARPFAGMSGKAVETVWLGPERGQHVPDLLRPLVKAWSAASAYLLQVRVVEIDVMAFALSFRLGVADPYRHLAAQIERQPQLKALIELWLATPPEKRVFRTLTQKDEVSAAPDRQRLEAAGYKVHDYLDCQRWIQQLCDATTVGAMAETAGVLVKVLSDAAEASAYLGAENQLIGELWQGGPVLMMVDAAELRRVLPRAREAAAAGAARVRAGTAASARPGTRIAALVVGCTRHPSDLQVGPAPAGPCQKRTAER